MANTVTRYQPNGSVTRLPDVMDRLFQQSVLLPSFFDTAFRGEPARPMLPVNLIETADSYVMQAALPGINADKLDIQVVGREVTIKGQFDVAFPENGTWIWHGIPTGEFYETYTLPVDVEGAKTEASYEHGILWLTLPKEEHARPKNVKVSVKS